MCKIATSRKSCADWPMVSISFYLLSSSSSVYNSRLDRTFRPCACCLCSLTFYFLTDYKQVCCRTYVRLNIYNPISLFLVQLAASDQNQVVLDNLNIKSEVSFILLKPINNSRLRWCNYICDNFRAATSAKFQRKRQISKLFMALPKWASWVSSTSFSVLNRNLVT